MAKCAGCNKDFEDQDQLELMRNNEGRWLPVCAECRGSGVDVNSLQMPQAVTESALKAAAETGIEIPSLENSSPLQNLHKLFHSLRAIRMKVEKAGRSRGHDRHNIEMIIRFTLARDDTPHDAVVKDLSVGGLKMLTKRNLLKGQIMQLDWAVPLPPAISRMLQSAAEVRRVTLLDDGQYEVGLRFVKRQLAKETNRRRFRRYKCEMDIFYQRENSEIMSCGKVRDISQGGGQVFIDEKLDVGELLTVRLVGGAGNRGDLTGLIKVCRVILRGYEYEAGCAFVRMKMSPHLARSAEKPPTSQADELVKPPA